MSPLALVASLVLSVLVGVALGLLGGGGSILTLPILVYVLEMDAHAAIATSLLVVGTTSAAALVPHARAGRVRWRTGAAFGATSMVGAYAAGRIAHLIPGIVLLLAFGAMMLVTAIAMMRQQRAAEPAASTDAPRRHAFVWIVIEGLVVGAVTGLIGAGGGFLVVPALLLLGRLPMREAVGTSLLVIAMKSFAAFAGHASGAQIDLTIAGAVTLAAIVGSVGGAALAGHMAADTLRKAFAWFVLAMAVFLLGQEIPRALGHPLALARDWPWFVGAILAFSAIGCTVALARRLRGAPSRRGRNIGARA